MPRRLHPALLILIALAVFPALLVAAEPVPPAPVVREAPRVIQRRAPTNAQPVPAFRGAATALRSQIYLPLAKQAPRVTILFASGRDAHDALINPSTTFPFGIVRLYHDATVAGARGQAYREAWYIDGAYQPQLDYGPIAVPFDTTIFAGQGIHYPSGEPLSRGNYRIDIYLNGSLYASATAVIA